MKKTIAIVLAVMAVMAFVGCASVYPVSGNTAGGSKVGEATGSFLFGLPIKGCDYSVKTAAKNGGITKINSVDVKSKQYWVFFETRTTVVTGD